MRKSRSTDLPNTRSASWYCGTVVRGDRLCDAVEFDQNGAMAKTAVIDLGWIASRKNSRTGCL